MDQPFGGGIALDETWRARIADLIIATTTLVAPPACAEIPLRLGTDIDTVWVAVEAGMDGTRVPTPFWSVAWVGGQALARHLLDHPETTKERRVLDVGAGSGLVAIAAALAGADRVTAAEIDPLARVAIVLNAEVNGVELQISGTDPLTLDASRISPEFDVIVAGDLWYERQTAERVTPWLRRMAAAGLDVFVGDKRRAFFPKSGLRQLAHYQIETPENLEPKDTSDAGVWQVLA